MGKLKILVLDDSEVHRKSAELTLDGDLTIVGTYDEAQEALLAKRNSEQSEVFFNEKYEGSAFDREGFTDDERKLRWKFWEKCFEKATIYPDFDVVLTDLMVPASRQAQGPNGAYLVGQEMPIGTIIALLALQAGIKKVAVVTDQNHHDHPASAAFDCFSGNGRLEGVEIICTNRVKMISIDIETGELVSEDFLDSAGGEERYSYLEGNWGPRKGISRGKNWGEILTRFSFPDE